MKDNLSPFCYNHAVAALPIQKLDPAAILPTRANPGDAGLDLYAAEDAQFSPGEGRVVSTKVALAVPRGHVGLVADRSSMGKRGLVTAGGVIDAGYRGELGVILWNISGLPQKVSRGERVAQLLIVPIAAPPVKEAKSLTATRRGKNGFGSSGR
jgi:dUTP pyrophosphatase